MWAQLLARLLVRLVTAGLAEVVARRIVAMVAEELEGDTMGVAACSVARPDPLDDCRRRGRLDLEDECYAWDLPRRV